MSEKSGGWTGWGCFPAATRSGSRITPRGRDDSASSLNPFLCSSSEKSVGFSPLISVRRHPSSVLLGMGRRSYVASAPRRRSPSQSGSPWRMSRESRVRGTSAYGTFHLALDEPVQLHRVLEGKLFVVGVDEAVDDHRLGLVARDAAADDIEELLFGDLTHRLFVAEGQ